MPKHSNYQVVIIGAPTDSGNRGVLALASSIAALVSHGRSDVKVTLMATQIRPSPLSAVINGQRMTLDSIHQRYTYKEGLSRCLLWTFLLSVIYRFVPIKALRIRIRRSNTWIDRLAAADLVGDIRGGDSFSDIYGTKRFLWGFLCASTALLVHGPIVQYPQTYGPYKSQLSRYIASFLLQRSKTIIARDKNSQAIAQALVPKRRNIALTPDVAFFLAPELPPDLRKPSTPTIGININGLMYNGGYNRKNMFGLSLDYREFLNSLVNRLLKTGNEQIWFIPHTYATKGDVESDNEASHLVRSQLPLPLRERTTVIEGDFDQHQVKSVIGLCDGFVGSRMHACIGALSQGIPCVGVAYSMKFSGVFDSVDMGNWVVDARSESTNSAVEKCSELLRTRNAQRTDLTTKAKAARTSLEQAFATLIPKSTATPTSTLI